MNAQTGIDRQVVDYCVELGRDPLLVQGAGGNVSWKDGDTLWVKASGFSLSEAGDKDIFSPVDLVAVSRHISQGDFFAKPEAAAGSLRPSIETLLHALMPHRIVVHLHAVEILAHLVRRDCDAELNAQVDSSISWLSVDYHKPGSDLARALHEVLPSHPEANVIFLKSHGVVIGGSDVSLIDRQLRVLTDCLGHGNLRKAGFVPQPSPMEQYSPLPGDQVHQLAIDLNLFKRLPTDWALYPDHVVFLGPKACIFNSWKELERSVALGEVPRLAFVRGQGVYACDGFTKDMREQLECYHEVLSRQPDSVSLVSLSSIQVAELLDWEAERYRVNRQVSLPGQDDSG